MQAEDIFLAALEKGSPTERLAFLDTACGDDQEMRALVASLLRSHETAGSFLNAPLFDSPATVEQAARVHPNCPPPREEIALDFLTPSGDPEVLGRIGAYDVTSIIGRGGMGIVLKAHDAKLNRIVAIKVMAPELASNPTARKRFAREAQAAAAVIHQHVVTIHAVGEDRLPFLVMEYIDGQSLQEKIDRAGHLQLIEILRIGQQIAAGLAAAHSHGLMHRDVKPANILLENGVERVRIIDFGLARAVDDVSMTRAGDVAGTPQYMSPEQAQGLPMDARSDLFSLGCVHYAMCTGRSPFRAETTVATMRRICDDTPRPIREINPEVPDWLVAIIDRLLAKDPADRFQTAAEVAGFLSQHLAYLQHPSAVAPVDVTFLARSDHAPRDLAQGHTTRSRPAERAPRATKGWLIAAAALLALVLAGLSATEATGVTHLSATVIRIFTPSGTLVVETDDPAVTVTIEGDGGLAIAGAGPQEVRLRPGSYKVQADKDGQPVTSELVTISRGGTQVVRVTREKPSAPPAQRPALVHDVWKRERGGVVDIALSRDGKQGAGCAGHDVFLFDPATGQELKRFAGHEDNVRSVVFSPDGRWLVSGGHDATVRIWDLKDGREIKQFATERVVDAGTGRPFSDLAFSPDGTRLLAGSRNDLLMWDVESGDLVRRFAGHTGAPRRVAFSPDGERIASCGHDGTARLWRTKTGELLHTLREGSTWIVDVEFSRDGRFLATGGRLVTLWDAETGDEQWRFPIESRWAEGMTFTPDGRFVLVGIGDFADTHEGELVVLEGLTGREVHRSRGLTKYIFDLKTTPDGRGVFIAESSNMRLRRLPASLWSDTPATRSAPVQPPAESGAFVLRGKEGIAERKFDTLAEAVQRASDGDTIEIRGNGPFVSDGVSFANSLVIRAGKGYAPSITLSQSAAEKNIPLLTTTAPLVLEGLELRRIGGAEGEVENRLPKLLNLWPSGVLHIANCRLIFKAAEPNAALGALFGSNAKPVSVRNSVLSCNSAGEVGWRASPGGRCNIENCVIAITGLGFAASKTDLSGVSIHVRGNSFVGRCISFTLWSKPNLTADDEAPPPIRLDFSSNVLHSRAHYSSRGVLYFHQFQLEPPFSAGEAEAILPRLIHLDERLNVYPGGTRMLRLASDWKTIDGTRAQNLADWNRLWQQTDTGSIEGEVRYEGGDLLQRTLTNPEKITAEDFRLRPDSAGYRASPDGKDLGADVDLVGPGAAYERWKKTPEYQEWLKETKQVGGP